MDGDQPLRQGPSRALPPGSDDSAVEHAGENMCDPVAPKGMIQVEAQDACLPSQCQEVAPELRRQGKGINCKGMPRASVACDRSCGSKHCHAIDDFDNDTMVSCIQSLVARLQGRRQCHATHACARTHERRQRQVPGGAAAAHPTRPPQPIILYPRVLRARPSASRAC